MFYIQVTFKESYTNLYTLFQCSEYIKVNLLQYDKSENFETLSES